MRTNAEGGQLTLNLTETGDLQSVFQNHYSVSGQGLTLQNNLEFSWTDFRKWALEGTTPSQTVIGLIHRYDPGSGNWYLTCGRYTFGGYTQPERYPISGPSGLFDLNADGSISNYSGGLQSTGADYYDPQYFNNVLYDNAPLNLDTNVRSVRFAWEELKQLHCDNKNGNPDDSRFRIRFSSIAPDCTNDPSYASVSYPHLIAACMVYDGAPLLNDDPVFPNAMFINKAADFGTVCPPTCPVYAWPAGLVPKNC